MNYALIAALALIGCANSSGVRRTDADAYTVTVEASPGRGGMVAARGMAFDEAAKKCAPLAAKRIAEVEPERTWGQTMSRITLDFKCVA